MVPVVQLFLLVMRLVKATSLNIIEHGIDYTSTPTFAFPHYAVVKTVSGAITEDETFTS